MAPLRDPKKDKRTRNRITKVLPVDCAIISLPLNRAAPHFLRSGDMFGGRTINLSTTGMQIHSDIELDPLTLVDVTVTLDKPVRKVTIRTLVAWAERNAFDLYGRWRMGMRIHEARPGDLELLNQYFKQLA